MNVRRNTFVLTLAILSAGSALGQSVPDIQGPMPVGHQSIELTSGDDGVWRDMNLDVWYPTGADTSSLEPAGYGRRRGRYAFETDEVLNEAYPLIVYSHGTGGSSIENSLFAESLASYGYVVAATTHNDGGVPPRSSSTWDRPTDVSAIIDYMHGRNADSSDSFFGAIDPDSVGVSGFSFGGVTSMIATAGSDDGRYVADDRIDAILPIASGSFLSLFRLI